MSKFAAVVVTLLVTVLLGAALAADVFQTYKLDRQGWMGSWVSALVGAGFRPHEVPRSFRSLGPAERAAVVTAMGAVAKAWASSPDFKAAYREAWEASRPEVVNPPRTAKQIADEMRAVNRKSIADMEAELRKASGDDRKRVERNLAELRDFIKQLEADIDQTAAARAEEERQRWNDYKNTPPDPDAPPADSRAALIKTLRTFLGRTAGVDYGAALRKQDGTLFFVKSDYEDKTSEWKMCFRAGKDACEAARTFAAGWLAELK